MPAQRPARQHSAGLPPDLLRNAIPCLALAYGLAISAKARNSDLSLVDAWQDALERRAGACGALPYPADRPMGLTTSASSAAKTTRPPGTERDSQVPIPATGEQASHWRWRASWLGCSPLASQKASDPITGSVGVARHMVSTGAGQRAGIKPPIGPVSDGLPSLRGSIQADNLPPLLRPELLPALETLVQQVRPQGLRR